jgi:gas vesicle protein
LYFSLKEVVMSKVFGFLAGAMCGAIVGAVAALLLTPDSGGALREQASKRLNELMEEGRKAAAARRAELMDEFEDMKRSS